MNRGERRFELEVSSETNLVEKKNGASKQQQVESILQEKYGLCLDSYRFRIKPLLPDPAVMV